jgi:excisionase family DNA binding protein
MTRPLEDHEAEVVATLRALGWTVLPPGEYKPMYTAREAAIMLGISQDHVYALVQKHELGVKTSTGVRLLFDEDIATMRYRRIKVGRRRIGERDG